MRRDLKALKGMYFENASAVADGIKIRLSLLSADLGLIEAQLRADIAARTRIHRLHHQWIAMHVRAGVPHSGREEDHERHERAVVPYLVERVPNIASTMDNDSTQRRRRSRKSHTGNLSNRV
jgi:hypothetical protein